MGGGGGGALLCGIISCIAGTLIRKYHSNRKRKHCEVEPAALEELAESLQSEGCVDSTAVSNEKHF